MTRSCRSCGLFRNIKGRGLCSICYRALQYELTKGHGLGLLAFPQQRATSSSLYCDCETFLPRAIPMFGAVECWTCGRPPREER